MEGILADDTSLYVVAARRYHLFIMQVLRKVRLAIGHWPLVLLYQARADWKTLMKHNDPDSKQPVPVLDENNLDTYLHRLNHYLALSFSLPEP